MTALAVRTHTSSLRRLLASRWGVTIVIAVAGGIALRVWTYRSAIGIPDSDEAVVGLMVRHMIHGQFTTFFLRQSYGGSQEALLTVPGFVIFGSSWLALRIVPIVLSALAAVIVWRVGRRTIGEPAASVAGALFWVWPPFVIYKLTHQWDFYASDVVYCALFLLLALRVAERPDRFRVGLFGLVLGLGFWQTAQIVPVAAGVIAWTIWRQPRCLRHLPTALPLALLGALPWIIWNFGHGWASLSSPIANTTTYQHRFRIFFSPILPMLTGLRAPFSERLLVPGALTFAIFAVLVGLFFSGAFRSRRRDASLLYLVVAVFPFVYAISPQTLLSSDPKYTVALAPVIVLLLAQVATTWWRAVVVLALAGLISVVTLQRMNVYATTVPQQPPAVPRDFGPLISTLDRLGLDRVYADYWAAYTLTFDTHERIIGAQNKFARVSFAGGRAIASRDPFIRWPSYERAVEAAPEQGFVFLRQGIGAARIIPQLTAHGYRRYPVGPFIVYARAGLPDGRGVQPGD